jgi:hypothetical protein
MIYIEKNALNKIFVDVSDYATLSSPVYLWSLQNSQGMNVVNFIPREISSTYPSFYANKYDVFEFSTYSSLPINLTPTGTSIVNIHLPNVNQFWLSIYEQTGSTNTQITNTASRLVNQLAFVFTETENDYYTGNTATTADNVIYYKQDEPVSPTPTSTLTPTPTPTIQPITPTPSNTQTTTPTPTTTPTQTTTQTTTPTPTTTPTQTTTPTNTPTPTLTPTPTSTPPVCYEAGDGFNAVPLWNESLTGSTFIQGAAIYQGTTTYSFLKINNDLTRDPLWNTGGITIAPLNVSSFIFDTNNKIILLGGFTSVQSTTRNRMARLNEQTGLLDTTFDFGGGVGFNSSVNAVEPTSDGGYVCGGQFTSINGNARNRIVKLNSTGVIDATFNVGTGFNSGLVNYIKETSDGKFIVSGNFTSYNGTAVSLICRLNSDGSLDATYAPSFPAGTSQIYRFVLLPDDSVVAFSNISPYLVKVDNTGTFDTTFATNIGTGIDASITTQGDIKILSTGQIIITRAGLTFNGAYAGEVVILNTDGTRDTSKFTGTNFGDITASGGLRVSERNNNTLIFTGPFLNFGFTLENRIIITDLDGNELMC